MNFGIVEFGSEHGIFLLLHMPDSHVGLPFFHVGSLPFVSEIGGFFEVLSLSLSEFFMFQELLFHVFVSQLIVD